MSDRYNRSETDPQQRRALKEMGEFVEKDPYRAPGFPWVRGEDGTGRGIPSPDVLADYLIDDSWTFRDRFCWDRSLSCWWVYCERDSPATKEGIHIPVFGSEVLAHLHTFVTKLAREDHETANIPTSLMDSLEKALRVRGLHRVHIKEWNPVYCNAPNVRVGFRNGVLTYTLVSQRDGNKITPQWEQEWNSQHDPGFRLTSRLPHYWIPKQAKNAPYFLDWLDFATKGAKGTQKVIQAYMRCCITGQGAKTQKFLCLSGPPGTGKGSLLRVFEYVLGEENFQTSDISSLENRQFESATYQNKLLVIFPDEGENNGALNNFKKLTGGDYIRLEKKGKDARSFRPNCGVIIATNHKFSYTDKSGAIDRRTIRLRFDQVVPREVQTFEHTEKLKAEVPGIISWALSMSEEEMLHTLKHFTRVAPELREVEQEAQQSENNIIAFIRPPA